MSTGVESGKLGTLLRNFLNEGYYSPNGISFKRARDYRSDVNSVLFDREATSEVKNLASKFADALAKDLSTTTRYYGGERLQRIYDASNREYSLADKYRKAAGFAGRIMGPVIGGGIGYQIGRMPGELVGAGLGGMGAGLSYAGERLGWFGGPPIGSRLADIALRRGAGRSLPGVPGRITPYLRPLTYGSAAVGAGAGAPGFRIPAPLVGPDQKRARLSPEELNQLVNQAAASTGLDPRMVSSIMGIEDPKGDPMAVSPKGAMGYMQLMPGTAKGLGVTDPFDPRQNIPGGARYFRQMLDRYHGNMALALAAYNAGPGEVDKYGGIPPKALPYVRAVISRYLNQPRQAQALPPAPEEVPPPTPAPATRQLHAFGIPGQPPPPGNYAVSE
jgi:hypothetical protein